tara:strand:+ start:196 stop:477 length:282 start_codon:yes stop_codon:yes gene_type:complete
MIKKKCKKEKKELINELTKMGRDVAIIEIKLISTSKVEDNLLYECTYVENKSIKSVPIIAKYVTQALAKLEQFTQLGIPENVLKYMLGNERYS